MVDNTVGPYEIVGRLGAGGMGEVYRARDPRLGRDVAIKMVSAGGNAGEPLDAYLLNEARQASALNHANICHVYDVGEANGRAYIAMELVPGQTLAEFIPEQGLPVETLSRLGQQVSAALDHAHEHGLVHRDLKAANIVITPGGDAKVLDFGLAKKIGRAEIHEATRLNLDAAVGGALVGTLPYIAPELMRGEEATERSDIWALGILLFEMACGHRPFQGHTGFELSSAILNDPVPTLAGNVPPAMEHVIRRCLERDPRGRYQHAREVRAALEAASLPSAEAPLNAAARPARYRRWALVALLTAGLFLAVVGTWIVRGRLTPSLPNAQPSETAASRGQRSPDPAPDAATIPNASGTTAPGAPLRPSRVRKRTSSSSAPTSSE